MPKIIAINRAERAALLLAPPLDWSHVLTTPFTWGLNRVSNAIIRLFGVDPSRIEEHHDAADLKALISESHSGGDLEESEAGMLGGVFHLHEQEAREVMTPIPAVVTVDSSDTVEDALRRCVASGHTRLVVIENDNPDRVRGIVHNNSLVRLYMSAGADASIEPAVRDAPIIPETKPLDDLLAELQRQRSSIAVVVDEYGRTVGIATIEDILEEVVGEIEDETDPRGDSVRKLADGDWYVRGHVSLGDVEDAGVDPSGRHRRLQLDRRLRLQRARPAAQARRHDPRRRPHDPGRVGAREPDRRAADPPRRADDAGAPGARGRRRRGRFVGPLGSRPRRFRVAGTEGAGAGRVYVRGTMASTHSRRTGAAIVLSLIALLWIGAPRASAEVVHVDLVAKHQKVRIADGVRMRAWTFNGTVPGPVVRAREGDVIEVQLRNADRKMAHSVDFHAAQASPQVTFADVHPGETKTFSFVARRPGVFMYHCGTSPVLRHIGKGMYGAIIVDPAAGRPPANETVLVQSDFYGAVKDGWIRSTYEAMQTQDPRFTAFNGRAFRYRDDPIQVAVGQPQRVYVVAAGPTLGSDFHVVGEIFDTVEPDGNPANVLEGVSTYGVPAGGGAMFELTFDEAGTYPFVNHAFRWADAGALGLFQAVG